MDKVFKALAEPNRVAILRLLRGGALPAGQIAKSFTISQPAVSQHLRALRDAGLIVETREGTKRNYRLDATGIEALRDFIDNFWNSALLSLKETAERDHRRAKRRSQRRR
jgi:DNA-binding transcriptional ArsR family regulator